MSEPDLIARLRALVAARRAEFSGVVNPAADLFYIDGRNRSALLDVAEAARAVSARHTTASLVEELDALDAALSRLDAASGEVKT